MTTHALLPDLEIEGLASQVEGIDHTGAAVRTEVVTERPLTIFLNAREIVTAMTIGDHPRWLAVGYLFNQGMLQNFEDVVGVDFEPDIDTVVVRTRTQSDFEHKLAKKMQTSGCAQGTVFGDLMDEIAGAVLPADARV
ncbi:MAG: formate dehydrogenase accessory sulfurtransferase FdhD, partial [Pseudomonadota bacterium]